MLCGFQSKATRTPEKVGEEELFVKYPTGWKRVGFAKDPLTVTAQSLMSFGAGDNVSKPWVISGKLRKRVAPDLIFVRRFRRTFRFRLGSNSRLSDSARRSSHVSFLSASRSQRQLSYVSEIGKGKDKIWKSSGIPYSLSPLCGQRDAKHSQFFGSQTTWDGYCASAIRTFFCRVNF